MATALQRLKRDIGQHKFLDDEKKVVGDTWFYREAMLALDRGHVRFIPSRHGTRLYLARFWITTPVLEADGKNWDSQDSLMLHAFAQGDDDDALHDHPWKFETELMNGGYTEHRPPESWLGAKRREGAAALASHKGAGPVWNRNSTDYVKGDVIKREPTDLHSVTDPLPHTWTLVRTGKRVRDWGFWAPGEQWTGWKKYLGIA